MQKTTETAVAAPPEPRRHLALGTLLATGGQVAPLVAAAGVSLAVARRYGPSGTGVMSLVMNLFDVTLMIFTLGLSSGVTYLVSRREWRLGRVARETRGAAIGLGALGAVCGLGFYLITRHSVFRGVPVRLALISLGSLPFALIWAFFAAAALGRDRYEAYTVFEVIYSLVMLLAGVAAVIAFGLTGAISSFAAANVLTAGVAIAWMRRARRAEVAAQGNEAGVGAAGGDRGAEGARSRPLARAFRFGLQAWSANLLQLLNYRLDIFILGSVAARSSIGVYSIAVSVTGLGWVLPNAFQTVLFPRVASLHADVGEGRITTHESDSAAARALRHATLLVLPTALALVVVVLLVPLVYGARFERSVALGFVLIPGVASLGIAKVASAVFSGRGFPRYAFYTTAITVPATVALYVALIPPLHETGEVLASTISYFVTMTVSLSYLC